MKISLDLYGESMQQKQTSTDNVEYNAESLYSAGLEAGIAVQKIETVFALEQSRISSESTKKDIELIAQGLFDKGGFFSNIWKAIADAFKRVADFIGQLFGKITGATEKNLKAVKDEMTLLLANSKFKLLTGDDNKSNTKLKAGSFLKVPKVSVYAPMRLALTEINNAAGANGNTQLKSVAYNSQTLITFYETTLVNFAKELNAKKLNDAKEGEKVSAAKVTDFINTVRSSSNGGNDPFTNPEKAVKIQMANFIKALITANNTEATKNKDIPAKSFITNAVAGEGKPLESIFTFPIEIKNINKPEEKDDMKKYIVGLFQGQVEEKRIEDSEIPAFLKAVEILYNVTIANDTTYVNTEKFFKEGKDNFMKLSEKYEDIAKEFEAAVNGASDSSNADTGADAMGAANQVKNLVGSTGEITKLTSYFTQLSLKWYSTVDGLLSVGLGNFLNLIKVAIKGLEGNTVDVVA